MNNEQIRKEIDALYAANEGIDMSSFVLDKSVGERCAAIEELQNKCTHDFQNGKCVYCDLIK